MASAGHAQFGDHINPGEEIETESGFLRGHGTRVEDGKLLATVSGFVERVNKLISVRPLNSRYNGEVGDVVIGRIVEVGDKRWRVDINSRQDGVLHLSSIILPGGAQRRRTAEDSLQMRSFFTEGDLVSAEVQSVHHDGSVALHTRSMKYGKLDSGQIVCVPQALVKRCKQHFLELASTGVSMILGNNGYIFLSRVMTEAEQAEKAARDQEEDQSKIVKRALVVDASARDRVARVRNAILALAHVRCSISPATIADVHDESVRLGLAAASLLEPRQLQRITQTALGRAAAAAANE